MHQGRSLAPTLTLVGISGAALVALGAVVALGGVDPGAALAALWRGAVGSPAAFLSGTLVRATPLILAGLAVAVAFRAGILNIGAEGQLLAGATAATAVASWTGAALGPAAAVVALAAGALAGAGWAAIAALLRARFGVLEVISTIMLNFVALYAVGFLVHGPLQEPTLAYPQSEAIPQAARLAAIFPGYRVHWGFALAVILAVALWLALRYSAAGFRVRMAGANPHAAASAGLVNVARTTTGVFLVSGALAGLAGAAELQGVTYALYENLSPGYGYSAIAVALLARLDPMLVVPSGLLFGALQAGGAAMQRDAGVPSVLVLVVEATVILLLLAIGRVRGTGLGGFGPSAAEAQP